MKLISWNVNGLRACVQKGFIDFYKSIDADIFSIQETKMQESQLTDEIKNLSENEYWSSAEKRGYSGTAIFSKQKPIKVTIGIETKVADTIRLKLKENKGEEELTSNGNCKIEQNCSNQNNNKKQDKLILDEGNLENDSLLIEQSNEGRIIVAEYEKFFLVNCYVPNSKRGLERLDYRAEWENEMREYLIFLDKIKPIIYCGDLNVAHEEIDLKNPSSNHNNAGFTDIERTQMTNLLNSGFIDTFRYKYPDVREKYSWWSYMFHARENNAGWRIDYFIVSDRIKDRIIDSKIHDEILGSDHCPIELDIDI